jgi:hypothetical protein
MRLYRLRFTDLATWRRTGAFWKREDVGDYAPMLYVGPSGRVERAVTVLDVERAKAEAGNPESQAHLGFMFATGRGASKQPTEARRWFRRAAEQGVAEAQYNLGVLVAEGAGGSVGGRRGRAVVPAGGRTGASGPPSSNSASAWRPAKAPGRTRSRRSRGSSWPRRPDMPQARALCRHPEAAAGASRARRRAGTAGDASAGPARRAPPATLMGSPLPIGPFRLPPGARVADRLRGCPPPAECTNGVMATPM